MGQKRSGSDDLIERLNTAVASLLSENRKLRRDLVRLTERAATTATKTAKRGARAITRRVKKVVPRAKKKVAAKAPAKRKAAPARTPKKKASSAGTRRTRR
jgi:uncharacterized coiled-coil protein SlyX